MAQPHAPAGPKSSPATTGIAFTGRTSVSPGISTITLKGTAIPINIRVHITIFFKLLIVYAPILSAVLF